MDKETIQMINLSEIYPHPDNPRKDLGDLRELTDSIEKNGIMQNLTVIRGHYFTEAEMVALQEQYAETHDKAILRKMHEGYTMDGYTLLIGHRRAEAARLAGFTRVPCTVMTALDKKAQVGIMLEENMQRNDLTIREQAAGFQMMLDLGDTVETVAKKTGFSKSTIKHRLAIAALDPKAIAAAEEDGYYQISISDYMKLEKLPTIEDRNAVLRDARNGRQLDYEIKFRLDQIAKEKQEKEIVRKAELLGVRQAPKNVHSWTAGYEQVKCVKYEDAEKELGKIEKPEECVWTSGYGGIDILRKDKKEEKEKILSEFDLKQNYDKKRRKRCREIQKEMDAKRKSFILRIAKRDVIPPEKDHESDIIAELLRIGMEGEAYLSKVAMLEYYTGKDRWELKGEEREAAETIMRGVSIIAKLMMSIDRFFAMRTGTDQENLITYDGLKNVDRAELLANFYEVMEQEYGYVLDEEERSMIDMTHEVFRTYEQQKAHEELQAMDEEAK